MRHCKYILFGILFFNIVISVHGQAPQTSLQELGLNGSIESILTERYKIISAPNKKTQKKKDCFDSQSYCGSVFFDRKGMLLLELELDNTDIIHSHKSVYNIDGYKISHDNFSKKNNTLQHDYHKVLTYDSNNLFKSYSVYNGKDTLMHKIIYQYNNNNQRIQATNYNAQGELISQYIYNYDKYGNKIKEQGFDKDNSLALAVQYQYDTLTNLKTKETHYTGKKISFQRIFYYNSDNLLSEQIESDMINNAENKTTHQYNISHHLTETIITYNNQLSKRSVYEYDHLGNRIKETTYQLEQEKWIPKYIIEHTIKYY